MYSRAHARLANVCDGDLLLQRDINSPGRDPYPVAECRSSKNQRRTIVSHDSAASARSAHIPYRVGPLFPVPVSPSRAARTTFIDHHDVTLEISKRRAAPRRGWSLVLSVKHLRGVINSGRGARCEPSRRVNVVEKLAPFNSPPLFSQGVPDLVARGSSISVARVVARPSPPLLITSP